MKAEKARRILDLSYISTNGEDYDIYHEAKVELTEIERLAEIGRATEKAFEQYTADITLYKKIGEAYRETMMIDSVEELLEWSAHERKAGEGKHE